MKRILSVFLALVLLATLIPAASLALTQYGYVTGGWLRLRSSPSFSASTLSSYNTGTKVKILGTSGSWYNVEAPDGLTGYMYASYVTLNGGGGTGTAYVTSTNGYGVRMRTGPGTGYRILGVYSVGTAVTVLESGTTWSKIQIGSRTGYMMSKFLTTGGGGGTGEYATIWSSNGYGVRLRTGPGTSYGIIGVYSVGTLVTILSHGSTWDKIAVGSRIGYMMNCYLRNYSGTGIATGIAITPSTASVGQGNSIALSTTVQGTNLSTPAYTLAITQNSTMATLNGDVLTVNATATVGSVIKVTATSVDNNSSGSKITAVCELTVTQPTAVVSSITMTPNTANAKQGGVVNLAIDVQGINLSNPPYTLTLTQNPSMATISGTTITIGAGATIGSVIEVTAVTTDTNSSGVKLAAVTRITVTQGDPVATGITIAPDTANVEQGASVDLSTTVTGSNLSTPAYTLDITQNSSMATLSGDTLTVNPTATVGSIIVVTATSVDKNSSNNKITATSQITVTTATPHVTGITITTGTTTPAPGDTVTLTTEVTGSNLSSPAYTLVVYPSDGKATINGDNNLVISDSASVGASYTITATSTDDHSKTANCSVTIAAPSPSVTGVSITAGNANPNPGDTVTLTTEVTGSNLSSPAYTLVLYPSDGKATIDGSNNLVISDSATVGTTYTVTATSTDDASKSDTCSVTVTAFTPSVSNVSISADPTTADPGSTVDLTVSVTGTHLSSPAYTLAVSPSGGAASINADNDLVLSSEAVGGDVYTVTATSTDDDTKTGSCDVTVATAP